MHFFNDARGLFRYLRGGFCVRNNLQVSHQVITKTIKLRYTTSEEIHKAMGICEKLGIDLQTYLRMCVSRLILENGIPFSVKLDTVPENPGLEAMKKASRIAEEKVSRICL